MGRPRHDARRAAIVEALKTMTREQAAAKFGLSPFTIKYYATTGREESSRRHRGGEPRCKACNLLLPCDCGGKGLHAVDFMRSGTAQPVLAFTGRFRDCNQEEIMTTLRCSSLPLAFRCPGSVHNDGGVLVDEWCQAGEDGTDVHRLLASHPEGDAPKVLVDELSDDARILYYTGAKMWREHISAWMPDSTAEVEIVRDGLGLSGHIDRLSLRLSEKTAVVLDWKSGRKDSDHKHQGFGYAVTVMDKWPEVETVTSHFGWLRTQELESYTMTMDRAVEWAKELGAVRTWDGAFHPGDHCTGCKRRPMCPAHEAMNKQSLAVLAGGPVDLATIPSPELAKLYRRLLPLAKQVEQLQEAIKAEGDARGGIDDGEGRVLHYKQVNGPRKVDVLKAWPVLTAKLTDEELAPCLTVKISDVEAAVATKAGKGKGAGAKRELSEALGAAGAVKQEQTKRWTDERIQNDD